MFQMESDTSSHMTESLLFMELQYGSLSRSLHQGHLKVENKSKKLNLDDLEQIKAGVPELDTKGLTECTKMAMAMTTVGIKSTMLGSQATMVYPLN